MLFPIIPQQIPFGNDGEQVFVNRLSEGLFWHAACYPFDVVVSLWMNDEPA